MNPTISIASADTGGLTDNIGKVLDPFSEGTPALTPTLAIGIGVGGITAYSLMPKRFKGIAVIVGAIGGFIAGRHIQGPQKTT